LVKDLYLNIGIGTTAANPPETFILNGSIIFRTNNRILFSIGVTSIFINKWDNGLYPNNETDLNIGLGYNF
jgi:hypothetical protein